MKVFTSALVTKFTGTPHNTLYTALSGRLYNVKTPPQEVFPYCIFSFVSENFEQLLASGEEIETSAIDFTLYSNNESSTEVYDLYDKLIALFDECSLTVTGYTHIRMNREMSTLTFDNELKVWQYIIRYRLILSKR